MVALDVVDSNFVKDLYDQQGNGVPNREMIGRHHFCVTTDSSCPFLNQTGVLNVQGHYHIYTKTAYYGEPYVPTPPNPPTKLTATVQ